MSTEFAKVLVVSAAHLGSAITTGDVPPMNSIASMTGDYGWLVYTGADLLPVEEGEPAAMQGLRDLLQYARKRGCQYVMFDADGPTLKQFPTYEW